MDYNVCAENATTLATELLVLPVFANRRMHSTTKALDEMCDGYLSRMMKHGAFSGQRRESLLLLDIPGVSAERVLLVGCGRRSGIDARRFVKIAEHAAKTMQGTGAKKVICCLPQVSVKRRDITWKMRQLVVSADAERYQTGKLNKHSKTTKRSSRLTSIGYCIPTDASPSVAKNACNEAQAVATGISYARDLGNLPGNVCTPGYLANESLRLAEINPSLTTTVHDEEALKDLGCGALIAVSQGSHEPGCLIIMEYNGGESGERPIALVGKGVTFDTGGLSIKPAVGMVDMKFDMCGAASVFGALQVCMELELKINVVAVIAAAENMPGSRAIKPNDVITTLSGKTVEVLNTDAEGRLVLCDALTYVQRYNPYATIDIATLTGASRVALGRHVHALFSNSGSLSKALESAGRRANDIPWPMPLMEEYQRSLDSKYADMANVGGSSAGAITAACFLWRFVGDRRWAHLDIAGTAADTTHKGSTGRPVGLLAQYLIDRAKKLNKSKQC